MQGSCSSLRFLRHLNKLAEDRRRGGEHGENLPDSAGQHLSFRVQHEFLRQPMAFQLIQRNQNKECERKKTFETNLSQFTNAQCKSEVLATTAHFIGVTLLPLHFPCQKYSSRLMPHLAKM